MLSTKDDIVNITVRCFTKYNAVTYNVIYRYLYSNISKLSGKYLGWISMILINPVLSLRSSRFSASEHPITHSNEYVNVIYKYNEYVKFKKVEKQPKTDKCTLQQLGGHLFKMSVFTDRKSVV